MLLIFIIIGIIVVTRNTETVVAPIATTGIEIAGEVVVSGHKAIRDFKNGFLLEISEEMIKNEMKKSNKPSTKTNYKPTRPTLQSQRLMSRF